MAMELTSQTTSAVAARKKYSGSGTFTADAGQTLKIETSPGGENILDVNVPAGKSWEVSISVHVIET